MKLSNNRQAFTIAIVGPVLMLFVRLALEGVLGEQARLMPFLIAVLAAAWWGGLGPGLVSTLLSVVLGLWFLVPPPLTIFIETVKDGVNALLFVVDGVAISLICEELHRARRRDAENQFRTLADSIPQLVWMARPNGHRFWFNQRWFDYTGLDTRSVGRVGWQATLDPSERDRVLMSWDLAMARGQPWEDLYTVRRFDGARRWHLSRAVPLRDARGEIEVWFGTNTDVTDRLESEQALKDANRRKDEFLATLAHELRNPLAPISNALQLWPLVADDRKTLDDLRAVIERQVQQMTRLIDDLMDASRISRGKIHLRTEPLDVGTLIARAVEGIRPLIDASGQQLTVDVPAESLLVEGDMARLTQVLSNLLHNAAKYTQHGGSISIGARGEESRVVICVSDNGSGIPRPMLARIFEMFEQVDQSLERAHGGLGIGLTLARQLVELHGGSIEADSAGEGKGSQFVVSLPRLMVTLPVGKTSERSTPPPSPGHRILVVDDVRESAQTLAMVLRGMGQDAFALHDGAAALEWIRENHPELVLLDIAMPGMNGYEVARRVRASASGAACRLVALTGYGQADDQRRALQAGFDRHATKPVSIETLKQLLAELPPAASERNLATSGVAQIRSVDTITTGNDAADGACPWFAGTPQDVGLSTKLGKI